jgi:transposase, IS6 family
MAAERGLSISASCIWRGVQVFGPEMDKRCRRHRRRTNRSWRLDETYINSKGRQRFLYRAVDSVGQTIDFLLTDRRDATAAKRFFQRALRNEGNSMPRVINVDKNPAYSCAVAELKASGTIS